MPQEVSIDKGAFRAKDWWWSKAALLMGMVYLFTFWFDISFEKFILLALLSLCTIIGFASIGYLFNDLFDIKQDLLAGKRNFLAGKPVVFVVATFALSLVLIFLPWLFLPADNFSYILIGLQLFLFLIYSAPPIRLKERGIAGIIVDSLYAHALPPILAAYTFSLAAKVSFPGFELILLFAWQFTSGVRNILMHLWEDVSADRRSGAKNYVSGMSASGFRFSMQYLIVAEIVFSLFFFSILSLGHSFFLLCALSILAFSFAVLTMFYQKGIQQLLVSKWKFFPNNVYERWLPLLYLLLCCILYPAFIIILLLHLALFNSEVYRQSAKWISLLSKRAYHNILTPCRVAVFAAGSAFVNYSIYYILLLVGINLRKENTSALSYFKKKWGKS